MLVVYLFFYIGNNLRTWAPVKCLFCKLNKIDFLNYIATRFLSRIVSTLVHQEVKFFEVIEPSSWTTSNFACDWLRLCHCLMIFQEIFLICMTRAQNDVTRKNLGLTQLTILPRLVWSVSPCLVKPTSSNASLNSSPRASHSFRASRKMPRSPRLAHKAPDMQAKLLFAWPCNWFNYLPQGKY